MACKHKWELLADYRKPRRDTTEFQKRWKVYWCSECGVIKRCIYPNENEDKCGVGFLGPLKTGPVLVAATEVVESADNGGTDLWEKIADLKEALEYE